MLFFQSIKIKINHILEFSSKIAILIHIYLIILTKINLLGYKLLVTSHTSLMPIPISMKINKFHATYIASGPHKNPKNISALKK